MRDVLCRNILCEAPYAHHPWEPDEQQIMRRLVRPGDTAFDIGAHFGEHSVLLAELCGPTGRVFAFEPNPERLDCLRRTVMQHGNGQVLPFAVADRPGIVVLYVPEFHWTASLVDWTQQRVGAVREITCEQTALDDLIREGVVPPPDFMKCDVEGAELLVFRGAVKTLDRIDAPIVMYEASLPSAKAFGISISASTEFLAQLTAPSYAFYWVQPHGTLVPVRELRPDVELFNLVAIPKVKSARLGA
jgi:FkbM family methyltransferase